MKDVPLSELFIRLTPGHLTACRAAKEIDRRFPAEISLASIASTADLIDARNQILLARNEILENTIANLHQQLQLATDQRNDLLEDICPSCGSTRWSLAESFVENSEPEERVCHCGVTRLSPQP